METKKNKSDAAVTLGNLLVEHKGGDVLVLDVSGKNTWAD